MVDPTENFDVAVKIKAVAIGDLLFGRRAPKSWLGETTTARVHQLSFAATAKRTGRGRGGG
jgi:hypothetical protein